MGDWEVIKEEVAKRLNCRPRIVDFIAVDDILRYCVQGLGISTITRYCETDEEYVLKVLDEFLDTTGWIDDLDINPLMVFDRCDGNYDLYISETHLITSIIPLRTLQRAFNLCRKYDTIRKEIEKVYGD